MLILSCTSCGLVWAAEQIPSLTVFQISKYARNDKTNNTFTETFVRKERPSRTFCKKAQYHIRNKNIRIYLHYVIQLIN